jgi:hypothetical protein
MKDKYIVYLILTSLLAFLLILDCTGTDHITSIEDELEDGRRVIHVGEVDFSEINPDKAVIIARVVYYIENKPHVLDKETIQLGFITLDKLLTPLNRADETIFYDVSLDKEGYFMFEMDREVHSLIYLYLGIDDDIHIIPTGALLNIDDDSNKVYAGEIHIIKPEKETDNTCDYAIDTYIEFYNNQDNAIHHLKREYSVNPADMEVSPLSFLEIPPIG